MAMTMIILGIESSCDDTAAAVIDGDANVLANVVSGQDAVHARFGGVVPELASRRHLEAITAVVDEALRQAGKTLEDIDLIAATQGPGLIGSLLVGFCYGKALAFSIDRPFVGVDHMSGHLLSAFLEPQRPQFPYLALIVSGGTTALFRVDDFSRFSLLGRTRDDAAGEAFDKIARLLDIGYPGGPVVSRYAEQGDPSRFALPRAWLDDSLDFSFSGLKTATQQLHKQLTSRNEVPRQAIYDLCASLQQAIVEVLVEKSIRAAHTEALSHMVIGGGVSANLTLRRELLRRCTEASLHLYLPAPAHCTDNAAMIAFAGLQRYVNGDRGSWDDDVFSRSRLGH